MPNTDSDADSNSPTPPDADIAADTSGVNPPAIEKATKISRNASESGKKDLRYAIGTAVCYVIFLQVVERIKSGTEAVILLTTLISLLFTLAYTVSLARGLRGNAAIAIAGLVSAFLILPSILIPFLHNLHPEWPFWGGFAPRYKLYRYLLHAEPGVDSILMMTCAVSIGVLISRTVKEFKILLPIAVVLALVDLYVVFGGGLVAQAEHGNAVAGSLMTGLTVKLPTVHHAVGAAPMQLAVGFADFLFIALFFACFVKFSSPSRNTFITLCVTLAGYMAIVALKNVALPALVPIAVVVVGMNLKRFEYARQELFAMLYAAIIVAVVGGGLYIRNRTANAKAGLSDERGPAIQRPAPGAP